MTIEQDDDVQVGDVQQNGAQANQQIPRAEDVLVMPPPPGGNDNPAGELIQFPLDQTTWVTRANLDDYQISGILSNFTNDKALGDNGEYWGEVDHFAAGLGISRGGDGRQDYLEGIKGQTPQVANNNFGARMVEGKNGTQQ